MKEERRKRIEAMVAERRRMTMEEICAEFGVSMNTVRADVAYLVSTGAVEKIYGGVRYAAQREVPLFTSRAMVSPAQKQRIASLAETLIEDKDIIFVDSGTTTMHLINHLDHQKRVTVVTANLHVIERAYANENIELIVLPGTLNRRTNSASDLSTLEYLTRYRYNKAFMGASGVSEDGRLNVSTYIEYEIKKTALQQSRESYLLADSAKFGSTGLMAYGTLADMTKLITDPMCPEYVRRYCAANGVEVLQTKL